MDTVQEKQLKVANTLVNEGIRPRQVNLELFDDLNSVNFKNYNAVENGACYYWIFNIIDWIWNFIA